MNTMKWNKAVEAIEQALAANKAVSVHYHRKWMKQDAHHDTVDQIISYEWDGETVKAVSTYHNVVDPYSYIIDEVIIEER